MRLKDADEIVEALDEALKERTDVLDGLRKHILAGFVRRVLSAAPTVDAYKETELKRMFDKVCELFAEDADWICDELNDDDGEREICVKTCEYRCCQPQCVERYVRRILKMDEVTE